MSQAGPIDAEHLLERPKLYSIAAIHLATFLGSCFAGAFLLSQNYRRFGDPAAASKALVLGALGVVGVALLIFSIPIPARFDQSSGFVFQGLQVLALHLIGSHLQGDAIQNHIDNGGEVFSRWRAAGVSLLLTPAVLLVFFGIAFALPNLPGLEPLDEFMFSVQTAKHENWERDDKGVVSFEEFAEEFRNFPWLEELENSNRLGTTQPTLAVENLAVNRFVSISIMGDRHEHYFVGFYGRVDSTSETRVAITPSREYALGLFMNFFERNYEDIGAMFEREGDPLEEFLREMAASD